MREHAKNCYSTEHQLTTAFWTANQKYYMGGKPIGRYYSLV